MQLSDAASAKPPQKGHLIIVATIKSLLVFLQYIRKKIRPAPSLQTHAYNSISSGKCAPQWAHTSRATQVRRLQLEHFGQNKDGMLNAAIKTTMPLMTNK